MIRSVIVDGVRQVVCEAHGGLAEDDPRLVELVERLELAAGRAGTQAARLEEAFVLLAGRIDVGLLLGALGRLIDAVLPQQLEQRSAGAQDDRGLTLVRKPDGGWRIDADLDDECGELLHTLLVAEAGVDRDNPVDTAAWTALRDSGWQTGDPLPDDPHLAATAVTVSAQDAPRSRRQQRHDALRNGLRRALDAGLLGSRDKAVAHLSVVVEASTLDRQPGALPAVGASGQRLPVSLVLTWVCTSALTRLVMSLGRRTIEASHTQRTLTALERKAKWAETGGICQAASCRGGPGQSLIPHHANAWARTGTTSLSDTVGFCEKDHHHLHTGHTILLKDGRRLGPDGWVE